MSEIEKFTTAPGLTFDALVTGQPGAPLVLLLHGFAESMNCWRAQVAALAAAGYRAVAPGQRGYSPGARPDTDDSANYHIERLMDDAMAVVGASGHGDRRFHGGPSGLTERPAKARGTSPLAKCCPATIGATRHGQRYSQGSAGGARARTSQGFAFNHTDLSNRRPAVERRTGIASQQPLLIRFLRTLGFFVMAGLVPAIHVFPNRARPKT
jgi:hypothetical protein